MKFLSVFVISIFSVISITVYADEQQQFTKGFGLYGGFGSVTFDKKAADNEGIKDSASYFRIGSEYYKSNLLFGFGISTFHYDDNAGFSQTVQDQFGGNVSDASSSASSFNLFGEVGYRFFPTSKFHLDLLGGFEQVLSSKRSIDNCVDCHEENINIDSGLYIFPRLLYAFDRNLALARQQYFTVAISYQQYFTGDVKNAIMLSVGLWE